MTTFNPNIFRSYDVRGVYREDFDAEFAQRLGGRIASYLKLGTVLVGRDIRASSDELARAVIDGALHAGATVIDVGHVSSPQFYWGVRELSASGGIMVTASHNPAMYNGFKVVARTGATLEILGGDRMRQIYDAHPQDHHAGGAVRSQDVVPGYAAAVARAAGWTGSELTLALDGPEPVRRAMELIAPIAPDHGLAVKFDADGDRIAFYERGNAIAADWIFLLLAEMLAFRPVVFDTRFSRAVRERLDRRHTPYVVSRVGRPDMVRNMHQGNAVFGGETSGHYYFERFGGMEAPELVLLYIARIVRDSGKELGDLIAPYRQYFKSEEVSIPVRDRKAAERAVAKIRKLYAYCPVNTDDGATVDCWDSKDWWFNIRSSNTESVLRVVVETKKEDLLSEKVHEVVAAVRGS